MRRDFIYPHRSVRGLEVSRRRIRVASVCAALLSLIMFLTMQFWINLHAAITRGLLSIAGIPVLREEYKEVFDVFGSTLVAVTPVLSYPDNYRALLMFLIALVPLGLLFLFLQLARGFVTFLAITLMAGLAGVLLPFVYKFDSISFTLVWLRAETIVWFLLPVATSFLFVLIDPSIARGAAWVLGIQIYGFLWSPFRLVFCLGLLSYAGVVVAPLVWFSLGVLADLVYILLFYSIMLYRLGDNAWGARLNWQQ